MADRFGYGEIGLDINPCRGCEDYDAPDGCKSNGGCGRTQTNADRIRSMTDEELAEFMRPYDSGCPRWKENPLPCSDWDNCGECWLKWLKDEVSE